MKLIFGQSVDKMAVESPIVFGGIKLHRCPVGGRGVLGVMSDFGPIDMKFGMEAVSYTHLTLPTIYSV